jgi:moderate conductance mechanosensitive channel
MTATALDHTQWHAFWSGEVGHWLLTKGVTIVVLVAIAVIGTRVIRWFAARLSRQLERADPGAGVVPSESVKHRQAVASVIASVLIAVFYTVVAVKIADLLGLSVASLVAPATVLGAALGFGAQRIVQDLLSGFFVITEKQYGFGDLVQLTITGSSNDAVGTVEDVTLRVTRLRTADGEMFTVPNGQIVKTLNLSKDWARAVVDIPVPASADLHRATEVLQSVADKAMNHGRLPNLLLDEPTLMGVESIGVDTVKMRMVARTLPGKQFEVGRQLRELIVTALSRANMDDPGTEQPEVSDLTTPSTDTEQGAPKQYARSGA